MKEFFVISEKISGDVEIKENYQYNHFSANNVIVHEGVKTRLYGNINATLTLRKNAKVLLHGLVKGEIINEGGRVYIFSTDENIHQN